MVADVVSVGRVVARLVVLSHDLVLDVAVARLVVLARALVLDVAVVRLVVDDARGMSVHRMHTTRPDRPTNQSHTTWGLMCCLLGTRRGSVGAARTGGAPWIPPVHRIPVSYRPHTRCRISVIQAVLALVASIHLI